jgi:hypothetical protein
MKGLLIPTYVENISTRKDMTVKILLSTQELTPEKAGVLFGLQNQLATTYINPVGISQDEIDAVDKVNPEFAGKTQSQRVRNVLFILFEQNNEGYKDFDSFYTYKTNLYIDHLKAKIS